MLKPMRQLGWVLVSLALVWGQAVPSSGFFRITETRSHTTTSPGTWRYLIAPHTKEARRYWNEMVGAWRWRLRAGLEVKLGPLVLRYSPQGLLVHPGCRTYDPRCFDRPSLPEGLSAWKEELILLDLHNALSETLKRAEKNDGPYPVTLTLSKLARVVIGEEGFIRAEPVGWEP
jgi:hypothetical protein